MPGSPNHNKAIFLDRDGVLNRDIGYAHRPDQLELMPDLARGLKALIDAGYLLLVVTNQSGVARGYYNEEDIHLFHDAMSKALMDVGSIKIDEYLYCPHHPHGTRAPYNIRCQCRKPAHGLLMACQKKYQIDLATSFMIGDKISDIECGKRAECTTIQIKGGYDMHSSPDFICDSLDEASDWIISR